MQPALKTERLTLRPCTLGDLPEIHRLWTRAETRRFLFDGRILSVDEARSLVEGSEEHFEKQGFGIWLVFEDGRPELAGFTGLVVPGTGDPELIYGIRPDLWGSGLATEAAQAVLDYCLGVLQLPRIIADVDEPNLASVRVLEKLGMRFFRRAAVRKKLPLLYFEMCASDMPTGHGSRPEVPPCNGEHPD